MAGKTVVPKPSFVGEKHIIICGTRCLQDAIWQYFKLNMLK